MGTRPGAASQGVTAWAIGDVHGQDDLLGPLLAAVEARAIRAPPRPRHVILLGDYIDRGQGSIAALQRAGSVAIPGVTVTALRGNHEAYLDRFLRGGEVGDLEGLRRIPGRRPLSAETGRRLRETPASPAKWL